MLTEEFTDPAIQEVVDVSKSVILYRHCIIKRDGEEIARLRDVKQFYPGEVDKVKEFIGNKGKPELEYIQKIWTQEVIDSFNQKYRG